MENLKFWLLTLVIIGALGGLGYLAFSTIDSGSEHVNTKRVQDLEKENEELKAELALLQTKVEQYEPQQEEQPPAEIKTPEVKPTTTTTPKPTTSTTYKHASLIAELEQLIKDNIQMKLKSHGTRVGTVQNFLNIYNNTSNKVDNDYGESTKKAVAAFQKSVGLSAAGEAGKTTFQKMVDWLKKQG